MAVLFGAGMTLHILVSKNLQALGATLLGVFEAYLDLYTVSPRGALRVVFVAIVGLSIVSEEELGVSVSGSLERTLMCMLSIFSGHSGRSCELGL